MTRSMQSAGLWVKVRRCAGSLRSRLGGFVASGFIPVMFMVTTNAQAEDATYKNEVKPFLEQRCIKCHGAELQKADQRFDTLTLDLNNEDILLTWQQIGDMLNLGLMPPVDEPEVSLEEGLIETYNFFKNNEI